MRSTKLGAALASLAVTAAAATVLTAGPAGAATATKATLSVNGHQKVKGKYGELVGFLEGGVTDSSGASVDGGEADLQAKMPGKGGWKTVKKFTDASFIDFGSYGSHAKGNVAYRLQYLGDATFAPTTSSIVVVGTLWSIHDTSACSTHGPRCHLSGGLKPKAKHHKITLQVKHGKKWKKVKTIHSNAKSHYSVTVIATRKKKTYRLVIAGTKAIVSTAYGYKVKLRVL